MAQDIARGGETSIEELMVATTKATLTTEMLVQVRNRAVEAYQEIMRMQV
jgi:flagellar hook-basal body complex protein FliE